MGGNPMIIVSGGSSIQERIIRTFTAANMYVFEGYGLTETSPVISVNNPARKELHPGTVGPVLDCIEFKLAEDGEILTKGDCLMVGYYKIVRICCCPTLGGGDRRIALVQCAGNQHLPD